MNTQKNPHNFSELNSLIKEYLAFQADPSNPNAAAYSKILAVFEQEEKAKTGPHLISDQTSK